MYIKVEPQINGEGILKQIAKIEKLSMELRKEIYEIESMIGDTKIYEKEDSGEPSKG